MFGNLLWFKGTIVWQLLFNTFLITIMDTPGFILLLSNNAILPD